MVSDRALQPSPPWLLLPGMALWLGWPSVAAIAAPPPVRVMATLPRAELTLELAQARPAMQDILPAPAPLPVSLPQSKPEPPTSPTVLPRKILSDEAVPTSAPDTTPMGLDTDAAITPAATPIVVPVYTTAPSARTTPTPAPPPSAIAAPAIASPATFPQRSDASSADATLVQARPAPQDLIPPGPAFPQPLPPATSPPEALPLSPPPPESPPSQPEPSQPGPSVLIKDIQVIGSTVFSDDRLNAITQPYEGKFLTLEELQRVADEITQLYLNEGYITSRAILANQEIRDGVVRIQVVEGRLEEIQVEGTQRLNPAYVRRRIRLGASTPLNPTKLEDQLRLLKLNPLFENVEASLRPGTGIGQSILIVRVTEAKAFGGQLSVDNYSPPSVGAEEFGINLQHINLTGNGDTLAAAFDRSFTGGSNTVDVFYQMPLNALDGTLRLRTVINRNEITQEPFNVFNIEGESELYELNFRQPLVRTPRQELALSLGFEYQDGRTFLDGDGFGFGEGPSADGVTRTRVFRFGQDYIKRDPSGAWALRSQFNLGTGLFDATVNDSPTPDSRFLSWLGQVQRVQLLGQDHLLIVQGDLQLTTDPLLPSQQFIIGGPQSLRGYRQNVRAGDNGFKFSIEDRITLGRNAVGASILQLAPFLDLGSVWNHNDNPNPLPSQRFLAGLGLGVLWEPLPRLNLRLDYGLPLVNLDDQGNNLQDDGLYFSVIYRPF
ncbi:BamA/TamA family outer membrane protein [Trichothermofontia sichuanensis B231]|uniref:ShlB/FhaC/HecB family hemolysin secretion/activation protein n=1 Tax=Trichothermofontia sichuanensis TaxID=3045816 RepID=UPI0022456139|nr:ShlB/FhaC/HecB family hemolysin secretion/activation protein [Trichothermofontia sichuanensis]UZQ55266.1 BamA/TamA family outer membrane protein [Trichothermofontia sichuanensis B231]